MAVGMTPKPGTDYVFELGPEVTVRGWAPERHGVFAGYALLATAKLKTFWTMMLVDEKGQVVLSTFGRTQDAAYAALDQQCEAVFGRTYSEQGDGPHTWKG
jgi:hypothetical protein